MKTHTIIEDPGHAWLRVSKADLKASGLKRSDFSRYSYQDAANVYLEEDFDLTVYGQRLVRNGEVESVREFIQCHTETRSTDADSVVRRLPSILCDPRAPQVTSLPCPSAYGFPRTDYDNGINYWSPFD